MTENRTTFINRLIPHLTQEQIDLVMFAYDLSKEAHRTQKRQKGGRYFEHPRAGCLILMDELGVYEPDLLISFLLHDVGEDTPLFGNVTDGYAEFIRTARFRIARIFGDHVADTVIRLTKPHVDEFTKDFTSKQQVIDHYVAGLKESADASIGKAIDRLHNLRSPSPKPGWIQKQIIETREVLLPVFHSVTGGRKELMTRIIDKIEHQIHLLETSPY